MADLTKCSRCDGRRWVCEFHTDQPWGGIDACMCGGAGMPCPDCNPCDRNHPPLQVPGFIACKDRT